MAQFDIHRLEGGELVMDLQTDHLDIPDSRIVAPLLPTESFVTLPGINPQIVFEDRTWVIRVHQLCAVATSRLGVPIGSQSVVRDDITRSLVRIFHGF
jgi:toxin CcdB